MSNSSPYRFAARAAIFSIPVLVCLAGWQLMLWNVGENWPIAHVIETEIERQDTLFKRAYGAEEMRRYRFENLVRRKPEIIAFGSSTTMEFREEMFGEHGDRFYNAGGLIQRTSQLSEVLLELEKHGVNPQVLIIGVDPWWLNIPYRKKERFVDVATFRERAAIRQDLEAMANSFKTVPRQFAADPDATYAALFDSDPMVHGRFGIGVKAREGVGFRGNDGSYRYDYYIDRILTDGKFEDIWDTVPQIQSGAGRFIPLGEPRKQNLDPLVEFLALARQKQITLGLFLIPLAPITHEALAASPQHQHHLDNYRRIVGDLAEQHDAPLVDATQPAKWGFGEPYMIDGFHASEVVMARIVAELLRDDRFAAALPGLAPAHPTSLIDDPRTQPAFLGFDAPQDD